MTLGEDDPAASVGVARDPDPDPIDQVRELLFGATLRATDRQLNGVEASLEDMRADFHARFATLENRLTDLARDMEKSQAASIEAIGDAVAQLGVAIQGMSAGRKG